MREFFRRIVHALEADEPVVLVSILAAEGSTPRGAGAMMAVFADGSAAGTIGGGNVEYEAQKTAAALLAGGKDCVKHFRFAQGDVLSLGMVCGGDVTVHFQCLVPEDAHAVTVFRSVMEDVGGNRNAWLLRQLDAEGRVCAMGTVVGDEARGLAAVPENISMLLQHQAVCSGDWASFPVVRAGKVYIFGGGHVSRALVPAVAAVGFRPVVYDDRPEFADPALFPQAERVLCGSFEAVDQQVTVTPEDYVVIMTRGHQADYEVLSQLLRSGAKYLGCIGSKRKLALCRDRLLEAGFTAEEYSRLHAPIGLSIGAETPEEIAVSVTAELIAVRAGVLA